jgi:hypothetical protein
MPLDERDYLLAESGPFGAPAIDLDQQGGVAVFDRSTGSPEDGRFMAFHVYFDEGRRDMQ